MNQPSFEPKCFVISPIGPTDSDIRRQADKVLKHIIRKSLEPLGFKVIRADAISEPGTINLQVMKRIVDSEIVVADLTGTNPNVMYELAIRHAIGKPVILLLKSSEKIPFDIATERTIFYDLSDIDSVENTRDALSQQVQFIQNNEFKIDTPFSLIEGLLSAPRASDNEVDSWTIALDDIGYIKATVKKLLESTTETTNVSNATGPKITTAPKWAKINIEFPSKTSATRKETLEISSEYTLQDVLNEVYWLLHENNQSSFAPEAYTYLWDWVLMRKKDKLPLLIKAVDSYICATDIISDGETWEVVRLDEPLLHKPERFNLVRAEYDGRSE
jgi:nucleoside 2-deoxyribosyltransferase